MKIFNKSSRNASIFEEFSSYNYNHYCLHNTSVLEREEVPP